MLAPLRSRLAPVTLCLIGACVTAHAEARDPTYAFNLPEERLADTLVAIGHQTTTNIVFAPETVDDAQSPAILGNLTLEQAVIRALSKTDLQARQATANSILIERWASTSNGSKERFIRVSDPQPGTPDPPGDRLAQANQGQAAGAAAVAGTSGAQSSSREPVVLQEIIVTAQKREERLQDVPVPVSVIDTENLVANSQVLLRDYYSSVPGLTVTPNVEAVQMLTIRGITDGGYSNPTVSVLIDGVPYNLSTAWGNSVPDIDPGDLARIEVLRGPQGTLYGANSMGGLINYVTRDPSSAGYAGRLEFGAEDVYNGHTPGFSLRGSVNVPVSDTLAVRLSGFTRQDAGYIDNPFTHVDGVNQAQTYGGRLSALWTPSETFSLKLSALYQSTVADGLSEADVPTAGYPSTTGLRDLQQNYLPGVGGYRRTVQAYSATIRVKWLGVDITSLTGYSVNQYRDSFDATSLFAPFLPLFEPTFPGIAGTPYNDFNDDTKFSQELRFSSAIGERFEWLLGGFYTHENDPHQQLVTAADSAGRVLGTLAYNDLPANLDSYAVFGDFTFRFTDRFDVQIGGRENHDRFNGLQGLNAGPLYGGTIVLPASKSTSNAFTYLLTPRFRFSPDLMLYARLASGFRPGAANSTAPGIPPESVPDKTQNYEIGLKADFLDHALSIDTSVYRIDWKDIQLTLTGPPPQYIGYTANGGRAKSEGVEFAIQARPWAGLSISAWVDYDNAVLTQDFPANATVYGAEGDRLPNSSRFSGHLALEQDFPLGNGAMGYAGGEYSYVGDRQGMFQPTVSDPRPMFPAYAKTDLRIGARFDGWTANLYVNNVADKRGVLNIVDLFPFAYVYIQPRTVGLNVAKVF